MMGHQRARSDRNTAGEADFRCPLCASSELERRHCKTLCTQCGYVESCEDNFVPNEEPPRDA